MRQYSAADMVGLWVFDEGGRVLGEVIGIVHHANGETSALLHSGAVQSHTGRMVSLDAATIVDGAVHLGAGIPCRAPAAVERLVGRQTRRIGRPSRTARAR